jgi:hypothetical protein
MFDGSYELRLLISCATKPWENTSTVKQQFLILIQMLLFIGSERSPAAVVLWSVTVGPTNIAIGIGLLSRAVMISPEDQRQPRTGIPQLLLPEDQGGSLCLAVSNVSAFG